MSGQNWLQSFMDKLGRLLQSVDNPVIQYSQPIQVLNIVGTTEPPKSVLQNYLVRNPFDPFFVNSSVNNNRVMIRFSPIFLRLLNPVARNPPVDLLNPPNPPADLPAQLVAVQPPHVEVLPLVVEEEEPINPQSPEPSE